ncbi:hypothetical protein GALMADRAFT_251919 [Galerina marginata CBS 339.88]|uniref:Uncharacterized protein n=1 Tax=Galerina marginata (strain CBS 339.88) TaxID=685588 RepID=A0A067STC0_GALM3|nr:hypothetical protein GALMADRAFT_251919 [Galerina marginata CBS 339.88]
MGSGAVGGSSTSRSELCKGRMDKGPWIFYSNGRGDREICILRPNHLAGLLENKMITLPSIREKEIQDRSKGDGLSKALVILQTTWFITQCIARKAQGLLISELELVTLAFAALNGLMCFFWWNKPLDIQTTVPVYITLPTSAGASEGNSIQSKVVKFEESAHFGRDESTTFQTEDPRYDQTRTGTVDDGPTRTSSKEGSSNFDSINQQEPSKEIALEQPFEMQSQMRPGNTFTRLCRQTWRILLGVLFRWPLQAVVTVNRRIAEIMPCNTTIPPHLNSWSGFHAAYHG